MRHKDKNRKFGRERKVRRALLRSLAENLILHGKMKTTEAKAKEVRPFVERLITLGKNGGEAKRRLIVSRVSKKAADKIFKELASKHKDRAGGYTRIIKTEPRKSDGARMAFISFV